MGRATKILMTTLVTGAGALGIASTSTAAAAPVPGAVYVDCRHSGTGSGTATDPFTTLAALGAIAMRPGTQVLIARGSRCAGTITITTSGKPSAPIVIGAYGRGPLPRLDGGGVDVMTLHNTSNIVVQDLEITTKTATTTSHQNGVHLVADGTTVRNVTIQRLYVHDIDGSNADEHGGIQIEGYGGTPYGKFDRLSVLDNRIERSAKEGIYMDAAPGDHSRPPAGNPWPRGSTRVVVNDNTIDHVGGDGILLQGTVGTLIDGNRLSYGNLAGTALGPDMRCNAGIWSGNQNSSVIQHNIVTNMQTKGCDGDAFDIDVNQDGTIIQDNVSIDNKAGFLMMCSSPPTRRAIVRYNISINDGASFQDVACVLGDQATLDGVRMYNNTFVAPSPQVTFEGSLEEDLYNPGNFEFVDNIVVATQPSTTRFACGNRCVRNLFRGIPAQGLYPLTDDPSFVNPNVVGTDPMAIVRGFRLQTGSPALAAGVSVPGVVTDFFGVPIPTDQPPSLGFAQGHG